MSNPTYRLSEIVGTRPMEQRPLSIAALNVRQKPFVISTGYKWLATEVSSRAGKSLVSRSPNTSASPPPTPTSHH